MNSTLGSTCDQSLTCWPGRMRESITVVAVLAVFFQTRFTAGYTVQDIVNRRYSLFYVHSREELINFTNYLYLQMS